MSRAVKGDTEVPQGSVVVNIVVSPALKSAVDAHAKRLSRERGMKVRRSAAARELLLSGLKVARSRAA